MPRYFDAHCHLQHPQIMASIVKVMAESRAMGVEYFVCCGTHQDDWTHVAYLADNIKGVIPSFGLHPRLVEFRHEIWSEKLVDYLVKYPQSGIGEIGLDFSISPATYRDQERAFASQLQMAQQLMKPVSVCCVYAWEALIRIMDKIGPLPAGGVIRGFTGDPDLVPKLEAYGFSFSFTNWICPAHATDTRKAIPLISPDRLLVESDSQQTILAQDKGGVNHPGVVAQVCSAIAQTRGMSLDQMAELTFENASRVFLAQG